MDGEKPLMSHADLFALRGFLVEYYSLDRDDFRSPDSFNIGKKLFLDHYHFTKVEAVEKLGDFEFSLRRSRGFFSHYDLASFCFGFDKLKFNIGRYISDDADRILIKDVKATLLSRPYGLMISGLEDTSCILANAPESLIRFSEGLPEYNVLSEGQDVGHKSPKKRCNPFL